MRLVLAALAAAVLLAAPLAAEAKSPLSKNQIAEMLSANGYAVTDLAPDRLAVAVAEFSVLIWVDGADGDISYITWIPALTVRQVGHEFLSRFNSEVKFGRAYVDRDGDITLQMDRNAAGGVSLKNIESDFDVFLMLISKFLSDLESRASA